MVANLTIPGMFLTGTHAGRPAASAVGNGTLYACSDHKLIYQSDGSSWSTWIDASGSGGIPATIVNAKGDLIVATAADTVDRKAVGSNGQALFADSAQSDGLAWEGGPWTDYTPSLTAVTTNPTLGSSTIGGRFRLLNAKTGIVIIGLSIVTGGAWNAGSGEWKFSLPAGWTAAAGHSCWGAAHVLDNGTAHFSATAQVQPSGTVIHPILVGDATASRVLAHNSPITWATGDSVDIQMIVELA